MKPTQKLSAWIIVNSIIIAVLLFLVLELRTDLEANSASDWASDEWQGRVNDANNLSPYR